MNQKAVPRRLVTGPGRGAGTALGFQPVTQLCEFIIIPFHDKVSHREKSVHLSAERSDSESRTPSSHGWGVHGWSRERWFDAVVFPPVLPITTPSYSFPADSTPWFTYGGWPRRFSALSVMGFCLAFYLRLPMLCSVMLVYVDKNNYFLTELFLEIFCVVFVSLYAFDLSFAHKCILI